MDMKVCGTCALLMTHYCTSYFESGDKILPLYGFCDWKRREFYNKTCSKYQSEYGIPTWLLSMR